jgi:hypothetical protein
MAFSDPQRPTLTELNIPLTVAPMPLIAMTATIATNPAIRAYSMAVTPD